MMWKLLVLAVLVSGTTSQLDAQSEYRSTINEVHVTGVMLGTGFDAETFTLARHTAVFAPTDTIYLLVETTGSGRASVSAMWEYYAPNHAEPILVDHNTLTIVPRGTSRTEFHVLKGGLWPLGDYSVSVQVNGATRAIIYLEVEE